MTRTPEQIRDWQRRHQAQPKVYTVWVNNEPTGNLYDSKEAAEREAEWHRGKRYKAVRVEGAFVDSLELAKERWG